MTWIGLVWAEAQSGVIGAGGGMPWHVPEDLAHFKEITNGSSVVMGRRTWESLPPRFRPLPGRANVVVTRDPTWTADGAVRVGSVDEALARAGERAWVIGGGEIFRAVIDRADRIELTELDLEVDGDTYAPAHEGWRVVDETDWRESTSGVRYRFLGLEPVGRGAADR